VRTNVMSRCSSSIQALVCCVNRTPGCERFKRAVAASNREPTERSSRRMHAIRSLQDLRGESFETSGPVRCHQFCGAG